MVRRKIDRNLSRDSTLERERDWRGSPQRQPELCVASLDECRHADWDASCYAHRPDVIPLRELLGTGK
jgi:hypothetical protein